MKVICVDDEKFVLSDLLETIREIPEIQEATGFRDIQEVLKFLETNSIQIAFLDIDMPEMNGLELCKKIHEISPVTKVIFTTGYPQFALDAFKNHAIGYLLKPVKKDDLYYIELVGKDISIFDTISLNVTININNSIFYIIYLLEFLLRNIQYKVLVF